MTESKRWQPPPETRERGDRLGLALRLVAVAVALLALYGAGVALRERVFTPRLRITAVIAAAGPLATDSPVRVGVRVANDRWGDGAAYVVLVIDGETEVEGPVTTVRRREAAEVAVTALLPPGWRNGTLVLYDAANDNARLDARHGIPVRVGTTEFAVTGARYPATVRRGDTVLLTLTAVNRGIVGASVVPIVAVLSETGAQVAETDGRSFAFTRHDTCELSLGVATGQLAAGNYFMAILLTEPATGQRIGQGLYRQPLHILP